MQSILSTFFIVTITWIVDTSGFTLSTGSCNAGISSIENTVSGNIHIGGVRSTLAEVESALSIQGVQVDPDTAMAIPMNADVAWEVVAFTNEYKGIFVRVETSSDDFTFEQSENDTLQRVDLCDAIPGVAGVSHRNATLKTSSSGTMNFGTAGTAIMDVVLVFGISESSVYAWSSFVLRIETSTDSPTDAPLMVPTITTATNEPTVSPVESSTKVPTKTPTKKPTKKPTGAPSTMPSQSMTEAPVPETVKTESVKVAIENIQVTFSGVGTIPAADLLILQTTMEGWYEDYFNVEIAAAEQRLLHVPTHRHLQQFHVPSVRNMKTIIEVTTQDTATTSGSNTITYSQNLIYDVTNDARAPADYALLPYVDTSNKNELLVSLKSDVGSLTDLSAISTPDITEPPTNMEESTGSSDGVSLPIIICIVAGVVIAVLLGVIGVGYFVLQGKRSQSTTTGTTKSVTRENSDAVEPRQETVFHTDDLGGTIQPVAINLVHAVPTPISHTTTTTNTSRRSTDPPSSSSTATAAAAANGYVVAYKDQSRDVTGMMTTTPMAQAIPYIPKNPKC